MVMLPGQQYYARMKSPSATRHRRFGVNRPLFILAIGLLTAGPAAWSDEVRDRWPAYLLELPDTLSSVFVADIGSARILRYDKTDDGLVVAHNAYLSIGENGAGKRRAWDRRTPLGIYFVIDQLDTSRLHDKYGIGAFPLDYPNAVDQLRERTGSGIWVHGVESGAGRRPRHDTDGCLALPNEDLAALEPSFVPNTTPVIVTPSIERRDADEREALVRALRLRLAEWEFAQESRNVDRYVALYAPDFGYRGLAFEDWASFRAAALERHRTLSIDVADLLLLADPVEPDLYLARFRHTVRTDDRTTVTTKRLYWQRQEDGSLKIIAEDNG